MDYLIKSVEILCKHYGKIGGFWFDGNWDKPMADWREDELYGMIRKYQPEAIIVNNSGLHHRGEYGHPEIDSVTFEQGRPTSLDRHGRSKYVAAEMCQTINNHWGTGHKDFAYDSLVVYRVHLRLQESGSQLSAEHCPTGSGMVDSLQKFLLETMGVWVHMYEEAIYN